MPPTVLSSPAPITDPTTCTPFASAKAATVVTPGFFREEEISCEDNEEQLEMEPIELFEERELLNDPLLELPINDPGQDSNAQPPGGKKRGAGMLPLPVPTPKARQRQDSSLLGTFRAISAVAMSMRNSGRNRQEAQEAESHREDHGADVDLTDSVDEDASPP
jgi:hypothetical protein